ncbi:MAG TPA: L,D-transpeptidase family protein [Candidatus Nitrosotalea sp.]|nr:L,D-transpeptidase family protein [Candidatus Nitrosotalea sp.]
MARERLRRLITTAGVILVAASIATAPAEASGDPVSPRRLRELLEQRGEVRIDGRPLDARALGRFYRPRDFAPAWDGRDGLDRASRLLQALVTADAHGLVPARYHLEPIRARQRSAPGVDTPEIELLLTDAFLRYASDVRVGRRPAGFVQADWGIPAAPFDAVSALAGVRSPAGFRALLTSLPPPAQEYGRLVEALQRYRAIAARGDWSPVPPGAALKPGDDDDRVAALRARLAGEDESVARTGDTRFDDRLEEAVRRFQARHGLAEDGTVGAATLRALNVPAADRIQQIVWNLERWRWVPRDLGPHYVTVNAADATLRIIAEGRTVLRSRVVVGDLRHPTPVVQARLEAVILNPTWNVPLSIAVEEILPRLRENPRYLADNHIVILERRGSDPFGFAVDWSAVPTDPFPFRLQQQPGPDNPLGRIKFDIPNRFDVYLHDTPVRSLFARPVRTASHGCIRVERADDLAVHVLAESPGGWTRQTLDEAIAAGDSPRITLARPLPVYILYWTAFVGQDGLVHFRDDVYGRDRRLAAMLAPAGVAPRSVAFGDVGGCQPPGKEASG